MRKSTDKKLKKATNESFEQLRCANVFYTDKNGKERNVGIFIDNLTEAEALELIRGYGVYNIDIAGIYRKTVSGLTYDVGDVVDDFDVYGGNNSPFKRAGDLEIAHKKDYFKTAPQVLESKNVNESYRRIVSRGTALVDNPLFVDFD